VTHAQVLHQGGIDAHLRALVARLAGIHRDVIHAHRVLGRHRRGDGGVHGVAVEQDFAFAVLREGCGGKSAAEARTQATRATQRMMAFMIFSCEIEQTRLGLQAVGAGAQRLQAAVQIGELGADQGGEIGHAVAIGVRAASALCRPRADASV
jgi:hypothetical protein